VATPAESGSKSSGPSDGPQARVQRDDRHRNPSAKADLRWANAGWRARTRPMVKGPFAPQISPAATAPATTCPVKADHSGHCGRSLLIAPTSSSSESCLCFSAVSAIVGAGYGRTKFSACVPSAALIGRRIESRFFGGTGTDYSTGDRSPECITSPGLSSSAGPAWGPWVRPTSTRSMT